jgi:hypothetical protein
MGFRTCLGNVALNRTVWRSGRTFCDDDVVLEVVLEVVLDKKDALGLDG